MLLRYPRSGWTRLALFTTLILTTALYYFLIHPAPAHGHGPARHILQRDLVSKYISSHKTTAPDDEDITQVCAKHGFVPYQLNDDGRRKVYDVFPFFLELDWFEVRLRTLAPYVDYFIIVEYTTTFSGRPNPPILRDNWERFKEFESQILHFIVDDEVTSDYVWDHTIFMKNQMLYKTFPTLVGTPREARDGDVIVFGDVDEIPKPETMTLLRYCAFPERVNLRSHFYYYSYQWLHRGEQWAHPRATVYHGVNATIAPWDLQKGIGGVSSSLMQPLNRWMEKGDIWDAAWHCSSCFKTIKEVQKKINSFSHQEFNNPENRAPQTIAHRFRYGIDLFARWGQNYDRVEGNRDVPQFVLDNPDRFKYLMDRDAEDAAFVDYWDLV